MKETRKIVHIDEDKCDGCGQCVPACHEGAIRVIDGKARLLEDFLCDGLGDCLGECPRGAIRIEEREADPFDEEAVQRYLEGKDVGKGHEAAGPTEGSEAAGREACAGGAAGDPGAKGSLPCGCPGSSVVDRRAEGEGEPRGKGQGDRSGPGTPSALRQWPVQTTLVPPGAPFLKAEKLLVTADCVPFTMADYHERLLRGNPVLVGCPKLDDAGRYLEKFAAILRENDIREITVAFMEVPCCSAMVRILQQAIQKSGKDVALTGAKVSTTGEILQEGPIA